MHHARRLFFTTFGDYDMPRRTPILIVLLMLSLDSLALGAEVKVEGLLKAVDAKERTLTVEKKTTKGTKELSLEVVEEAGDLASLKVGDEVSVNYDSTLEVVTKIISPAIESTEPEVVAVKELGAAGHPWITRDGLTIYFTTKESPQEPNAVWMATRANPEALFKGRQQVSLGFDCTFSEDGLEGIVFLPEEGKGTLQVMRRKNVTDDFGRPTLIKELGIKELGEKDNFIVAPSLSADCLTLFAKSLERALAPALGAVGMPCGQSRRSCRSSPLRTAIRDFLLSPRMVCGFSARIRRSLIQSPQTSLYTPGPIRPNLLHSKGIFRPVIRPSTEGFPAMSLRQRNSSW